jgi:threonine/homoserine/homoserine lactone efflux protein
VSSWLVRILEGAALAAPALLTPGPLQAFLLARTLQSGVRGALPACLAPLFSDVFIIGLVVLLLRALPERSLDVLRLVGVVALLALAYWVGRSPAPHPSRLPASSAAGRKSLAGAIALNLLNPNPYLFWAIIGGPILLRSWAAGPRDAAAFLVGFYGAFVIGLASTVWLFGTVGHIDPRLHRGLRWLAAAALAVFGAFQVAAGWRASWV